MSDEQSLDKKEILRPRAAWVGGVCKTCGAYTHSCKCDHGFDRSELASLFAAPKEGASISAGPAQHGESSGPLHANAPAGCKCADCSIDGEACPACYSAWWGKRHPNVTQSAIGSSESEHIIREVLEEWTDPISARCIGNAIVQKLRRSDSGSAV